MKIQKAHQTFAELLAKTEKKSEKKVYEQLLGALSSLNERDLSVEQLRSIEEAIDRDLLPEGAAKSAKELKRGSNSFMKYARELLSLIPENYYTGLGMVWGVAFGGLISSFLQGFAGIPDGTSGTGTGIGIGLMAGSVIGYYLDDQAKKQNRVLLTTAK